MSARRIFRRSDDRCRCRLSKGDSLNGEDQGEESGRRDGRRRDDPDHLEAHQGQADPSLPRHRPALLRSQHPEARRDQRPDHHRRRQQDPGGRRRGEVRHHHAGRRPREGIQSEGDVALAERHHPQHPRRRHLPRADHLQERAAPGAGLDQADHHRPPRLRRPVPRHRLQGARQGHADAHVRRRRRHRDRARGVQASRAPASRWRCTTSTIRSAISPAPR